MKYLKILIVLISALLITTACDDSKMEWEVRDPNSQISPGDIPLKLAEKIARYDVLNSYSNVRIGIGVDLPTYMDNETYAQLVNENFDEVVIGYDMKHGAMVNGKGEIDFTNVDNFLSRTKEAGLITYGHTLVWHQNQNAAYLNGLIAPEVVPAPPGTHLLDLSGLKDASLDGWDPANPGDGIEVVEGEGLSSEAQALRMVASASSGQAWDLQIISPEIMIIEGHSYEISFYIRSDMPGQGRISFSGLSDNYQWKDWLATGSASEAFQTTSAWQQVKFTINDFVAPSFTMAFDLGYEPSVTYHIDVDNIIVVDLDAEPTELNYVENAGFETGDLTNWVIENEGAGIEVTDETAYTGTYSLKLIASETSKDPWDVQLRSDEIILEPGKDYMLSFFLKADQPGEGRVAFPGLSDEWPWNDWTNSGSMSEAFEVTTSWQQFFASLDDLSYKSGENSFLLSFELGYLPDVTYYLDEIKLVKIDAEDDEAPEQAPVLKSATVIEKSDEEKTQIIGTALEDWISQMLGHYRNDVKAWDVVNEPMKENGTLRDGIVSDPADDEFYWVKYLGEDYAVTAFSLARQYGNADDILFINDYNLENNIAKCDGLIQYVEYIESKGAKVDGIGTQMHVSVNSNKDNIILMFEKLAASGKLIKISELDIQLGTTSPSAGELLEQAEMYQFIVEQYLKIIPEDQQFGITVWGLNDPNGKGYWLPDDSPCLWNHDFVRKPAYKAFVDALAGRDVSEDFTGEDYY